MQATTQGAILLLGPPGAGKSILGRALQSTFSSQCDFLSVADELRDEGLLQGSVNAGPVKKIDRQARAKDLLHEACHAAKTSGRVLVLELVKELDDAYSLIEALEHHSLPLLEVLYIPDNIESKLPYLLCAKPAVHVDKRLVAEHQAKWVSNAGQLLEFFSALGVLSEVTLRHQRDTCLAVLGYKDSKRLSWVQQAGWFPVGEEQAPHNPAPASRLSWQRTQLLQHTIEVLQVSPIQPLTSQRLVTSRTQRTAVIAQAHAATGLTSLPMPSPSLSICNPDDVPWLAWPGRYMVSRKADGTRHLLIVTSNGSCYLHNRLGTLYAFPAVVPQAAGSDVAQHPQQLPPGTVLDGELLFVNGSAFYLAFDAQAVASRPVWHLPLDSRLSSLASLGLQLAETHQPLISATSAATQSGRPGVHGSNRPSQLVKKQQAPEVGRDTITVLRKQHLAFSADSVQELSTGHPYPCNGLIAAPCTMSYVLGMQQLLYKIQETKDLRLDLQAPPWYSHDMIPPLIYECTADGMPLSIRFDKAAEDSEEIADDMREMSAARHPPSLSNFIQAIKETQACEQLQPEGVGQPQRQLLQPHQQFCHPARTMPFQQLQLCVAEAVAAGTVERTCDQDTGLEAYNYTASAPAGAGDGLADICRGLILHAPTQTVVATPFPRFLQPALEASSTVEAPAASISTTSTARGRKQAATLPASAAADLTHTRATLKVDGSLVIAFLWQGQVHAATCHSMDSEQARWATAFLRARPSAAAAMQPGWTYLFEAVCADNTHVVQYPFEGLVLLDAVNPVGQGLEGSKERVTLAETFGAGVIPVPELTGAASDLRAKLSEGTMQSLPSDYSRATAYSPLGWSPPSEPPAHEGWVLQGSHGSREKLVQYGFKWVNRHAQQLHPLAVWDAVCFGRLSRAELQQDTPWPQHMRTELGSMLDALQQGFHEVQKEMLSQLATLASAAEQQQADAAGQGSTAAPGALPQGVGHDMHGTGSQQQVSESAADALADPGLCATANSTQAGSSKGTQSGQVPVAAVAAPSPQASASEWATSATAGGNITSEQATPGSVSTCDVHRPAEQQEAAMQAAVHYMQDKQGAVQSLQETPMDMYYHRWPCIVGSVAITSHPASEAAPRLRRLLLECVKPNKDGSGLPGYQPSPNFQQTWAKGWAAGPQLGHATEQPTPLVNEVLPLVYDTLLKFLEAEDVVQLGCTCSMWSQLVSSHPGFAALCTKAKRAWGLCDSSAHSGSYEEEDPRNYDDYGGGYQDSDDYDNDY